MESKKLRPIVKRLAEFARYVCTKMTSLNCFFAKYNFQCLDNCNKTKFKFTILWKELLGALTSFPDYFVPIVLCQKRKINQKIIFCANNLFQIANIIRGHSITTWTRWDGRGQKMAKFCQRSCWMPTKSDQGFRYSGIRGLGNQGFGESGAWGIRGSGNQGFGN